MAKRFCAKGPAKAERSGAGAGEGGAGARPAETACRNFWAKGARWTSSCKSSVSWGWDGAEAADEQASSARAKSWMRATKRRDSANVRAARVEGEPSRRGVMKGMSEKDVQRDQASLGETQAVEALQ